MVLLETLLQMGRPNGPENPGKLGGAFLLFLGVFFAIVALSPGVRVRGAFARGSGESVPINKTGRVLLLLVALTLSIVGIRAFVW